MMHGGEPSIALVHRALSVGVVRLALGFMLPGLRANPVHAGPGDPAVRPGPDHVAVRGMRLDERRRPGQTWATSAYDLGENEVSIAEQRQPVADGPTGLRRLEDPAGCRRPAAGPADGRA